MIVYFAFTQEASFTSLTEWAQGTALAPKPLPAGSGVGVRRLTDITVQPTHHYYHYGLDDRYDDDDDDTDVIVSEWRELMRDRALLARQYRHQGLGKLLYDAVAVANLVRSMSNGNNSDSAEVIGPTDPLAVFAVDLLEEYNPSFDREECSRAFSIGLEYTV